MSRPRAAWLAWGSCGLSLVLVALGVLLFVLNGSDVLEIEYVIAVAFPPVGALIASRQPRNPIGWIFCGAGLLGGLAVVAPEYALYSLRVEPGSLPGGAWFGMVGLWAWFATAVPILTFLPLVFPDGRLLSPRWRWVARVAAAALAVAIGAAAVYPDLGEEFPGVDNPLGIDGAKTFLDGLSVILIGLLLAATAASVVSAVLRFRRSQGMERQQLKWFAVAIVTLTVLIVTALFLQLSEEVFTTITSIGVALIPVSVGIAILRYRLYDIDVIIRRTLVYGVLTAGLAGLYFGIVVGLQQALGSVTQGSDLAIAGSTLAVAALFRPARRRIQELVDRRFYRRKFDATQTLETFSARLRREIDLDSLSRELRSAVVETMRPAHVSVWLKPEESGR